MGLVRADGPQRRCKMTKNEKILKALENIIQQRGELRQGGIAIDDLPGDFNKIIDAAKVAYHKYNSAR